MQTRTIPEAEWVEYFDQFSRDHVGWIARVEVLDAETGPLSVADGLPFGGISLDVKGSRPCTLEISVGDRPGRHVNHAIDMPLFVREADESNGDVDLEVEPSRGPKTLIHLQAPVH